MEDGKKKTFQPPRFLTSLLLICLAAFLTISLISARISEHVPHSEDEVAYIFQAKVFAQNRLTVPTPLLPQLFWSPFVADYQGHRFGKYPPGWPLLLSLGVRLRAPWLVNTALASATLGLIGWLGAHIYEPKVGLGAAALGLTTPGFLLLSASLLSHTASLFWTSLALVALIPLTAQTGVKRNSDAAPYITTCDSRRAALCAALSGLALGAAFTTRPFAALGVGLAVGIFLLALTVQGEVHWTTWLWLIGGGTLAGGLLPLYWWTITGDPAFNAYLLVWPYDRIGFGPQVGPYGYDLPTALLSTRLKLMALASGLFGWPGWSSVIFLPLPFLAGQARRWDWLLLGTIAGLVFVHFFYWAFGGVDGGFPRYYYDALPALLLLTVRGIQISGRYLKHRSLKLVRIRGQKVSLGYLPLGLAMILISYNLARSLPAHMANQKGKYDITPAPLQALARANLAGPALVIVKRVESWRDFAAPFAANSPTLDGPIVYAIDGGPGLNSVLRTNFPDRTCWELSGDRLTPCSAPANSH